MNAKQLTYRSTINKDTIPLLAILRSTLRMTSSAMPPQGNEYYNKIATFVATFVITN
jgi:hypothetical protein